MFLPKTITKLNQSARRLSLLLGEKHGLVSYSGTVRELGAFVVGGPEEEEWADANILAGLILEHAEEVKKADGRPDDEDWNKLDREQSRQERINGDA